ncbi:hypothetical protein JZ751_008683 [Albula glossodonta]|uniref:CCDC113/CCDC96 coiled-coil domain-containing protein n=1 Tax=Albula glossodonta TaxID=121402 RepID=A0A8T2NZN0_9TELE|nr:hypothetical protein JZ751_008683 [Albula glossodonta]
MESNETEPKTLLQDESSPAAEASSTEVGTIENPEEASDKETADDSSNVNTDGINENAGRSAENTGTAEEGEVGENSATEITGSAAGESNVAPKEEIADDDAGTAVEETTDECAESETVLAVNDGTAASVVEERADPPSSETFEELGEEGSLSPKAVSDEVQPKLEENKEGEEDLSKEDPGGSEGLVAAENERRELCIDYEKYETELLQLQNERERLNLINCQLQMKLVEYFRKKTGEDTRAESEVAALDHEQRFLGCMASMEELKKELRQSSVLHERQIEEAQVQMQEKVDQADKEWRAFIGMKRDVAVAALSQRIGRQAAAAEVEQLQANEQRKESELIQVRLENIKLRNMVQRMEALLTTSADLSGGLNLIDFEQLKIENQTYEEKIEERNEELVKLRRKVGRSVQMLTHVTAKLHLLQVENQAQKDQRAEVDTVVNSKRDVLTRTKQVRDGIRADNLQLRQRCGLLGNETLLRDFEDKRVQTKRSCISQAGRERVSFPVRKELELPFRMTLFLFR